MYSVTKKNEDCMLHLKKNPKHKWSIQFSNEFVCSESKTDFWWPTKEVYVSENKQVRTNKYIELLGVFFVMVSTVYNIIKA